ncbi:MAG TPA: heavy-metal-associated domain-containing protein [Rubrivivax sp.]|nr:heavy-metal-associated domain-containing protein [Burkholderiales bacterium]HNT39874.1 heavy-metal-associated domain-containing protein [Rubrivivax sp.]
MLEYDIAKLSCGHCVRAVTEAVQEVDPAARVDVDLARKHVSIDTQAEAARIVAALAEAGYPPVGG